MTDLDRFVTLGEAAKRLAMGRSTVYEMTKDGRWEREIGVPIQIVNGRQVVSLRRLVERINGAPIGVAS